jgi:hypothetical protein
MSSSVQSEVSSQGPASPKKKYQQTEGKGSLEESVHNVKHLDLNMARSNHSVDFSTLDNSDGSSDDEIVEVDETETGFEEDNDIENEESKTNDVVVVDNNDDSSYEEEVLEEEIYDLDDDEEMENTEPATGTVIEDAPIAQIQRMTVEEEIAQHQSATYSSAPQPTSYQQSTDDSENKNLSWEKPAWTKSPVLKNTAKGQFMKAGGTVSAPITNIAEVAAEKKDLSFQKPDWTKNTKLRSTGKAEVLKSEGNLAKPITSLPHLGKEFDKDEPTMLEKANSTPVQKVVADYSNNNDDNADEVDDKKIGWEKPDWTKKPVLKGTAKGDKLKSGGTLSRPIGGIKPIDD